VQENADEEGRAGRGNFSVLDTFSDVFSNSEREKLHRSLSYIAASPAHKAMRRDQEVQSSIDSSNAQSTASPREHRSISHKSKKAEVDHVADQDHSGGRQDRSTEQHAARSQSSRPDTTSFGSGERFDARSSIASRYSDLVRC